MDIKRNFELYHSTFPIRDVTRLHAVLWEMGITVLPDIEGIGGVRHWIEKSNLKEPVFPLSYDSFRTLMGVFGAMRREVKTTTNDTASFNNTFGDELTQQELSDTCRMFALTPDLEDVQIHDKISCKDFLSWAVHETGVVWGNTKEQSQRARQYWQKATRKVLDRIKSADRVKRLIRGGREALTQNGIKFAMLQNTEELQTTWDGLLQNHEERIKSGRAKFRHWNLHPLRSIKPVEALPQTKLTVHQALMRMCVGLNGDSVSCQLARKLRDMMHRRREVVQLQEQKRPRSRFKKPNDGSEESESSSETVERESVSLSSISDEVPISTSAQGALGPLSPGLSREVPLDPTTPEEVLAPLSPRLQQWTKSNVTFRSPKWYERTTRSSPIKSTLLSDLKTLCCKTEAAQEQKVEHDKTFSGKVRVQRLPSSVNKPFAVYLRGQDGPKWETRRIRRGPL